MISTSIQFHIDMDYLFKHEKDSYKYVSMEKVDEISERRSLYKKISTENSDFKPGYAAFKTKLKQMRQVKLPFRCIDLFHQDQKPNAQKKLKWQNQSLFKDSETLVERAKPLERQF